MYRGGGGVPGLGLFPKSYHFFCGSTNSKEQYSTIFLLKWVSEERLISVSKWWQICAFPSFAAIFFSATNLFCVWAEHRFLGFLKHVFVQIFTRTTRDPFSSCLFSLQISHLFSGSIHNFPSPFSPGQNLLFLAISPIIVMIAIFMFGRPSITNITTSFILSRVVESESRKVGKSLKIEKNRKNRKNRIWFLIWHFGKNAKIP